MLTMVLWFYDLEQREAEKREVGQWSSLGPTVRTLLALRWNPRAEAGG